MDAYSHITPIERGCIMTLFNQGHSPAAIATMLKRHRCTILRELKRIRLFKDAGVRFQGNFAAVRQGA